MGSNQTEKKLIVFVDDEQAVLQALKRTLRGHLAGADIFYFSSAKAALDFSIQKKPDVVVSDIRMPEMDGLDLVTAVREQSPLTKTILLTGTADLEAAQRAINTAGVFRFFTKPCATEVLTQGIEAALKASPIPRSEMDEPSGLGGSVLNHLKLAVLIVDVGGQIVFANTAAEALLEKGKDLFRGSNDKLRTSDTSETRDLHALIAAAALNRPEQLGDGVLAISRGSEKRPLCLAISTLAQGSQQGGLEDKAIIFVSDPDLPAVIREESIENLFKLTPAEAKLAHALALGEPIAQAALKSNVTLSTARTYLKQIFQKTETRRQSELIKLILSARITA